MGQQLLWGFLDPSPPEPHPDGDGAWTAVAGGWKQTDAGGEPLTHERLAGALTMLTGYRRATCTIDAADYAVRRTNGRKTP